MEHVINKSKGCLSCPFCVYRKFHRFNMEFTDAVFHKWIAECHFPVPENVGRVTVIAEGEKKGVESGRLPVPLWCPLRRGQLKVELGEGV